jgi:hypothetical protein
MAVAKKKVEPFRIDLKKEDTVRVIRGATRARAGACCGWTSRRARCWWST